MIKKLNQYLLTHYPVIWNLRLVPVLILTLVVQIFLFIVGYGITDNTLQTTYSSEEIWYYLLMSGSVLTAILIFIFWLIQYNRNNALKANYPQSNKALYLEWICVFLLSSFICFIPNSLSLGKSTKIKSALNKEKIEEHIRTLEKARVLIVDDIYNFQKSEYKEAILVGNADVNRSKFDTKLFTYEEDALTPDNPIEYIGPSLLYYEYGNSYYQTSNKGPEDVETVRRWLIEEKQDSIRQMMQAFIDLHGQHKLRTNLSVDEWMDMLYHPPLFPIKNKTEIKLGDYYITNHITQKYTQYHKLRSYYDSLDNEYENNYFSKWSVLIALTIGLGLSVMVFSARFTSGRSWIFALLAVGVLSFAFGICNGMIAMLDITGVLSSTFFVSIWLVVLIVIGFAISIKVSNSQQKGRSNIYMNIGLWLIPAIVPIIYFVYYYFKHTLSTEYIPYDEDEGYFMLIINIIFTTAIMYPVVMLLRKWKALPED